MPAVEDFSQQQEAIERSQRSALSSMSSTDDDDVYTFKGDRLLTADQLREHLAVRTLCLHKHRRVRARFVCIVTETATHSSHELFRGTHACSHIMAYHIRR